jgi:hypothetical protein
MPNGWLPPTPPVARSLARALSPPVHALDTESGIAIPKRAHTFSPRTARHPAWHRSPSNVPPLPSTLDHLILPGVTRKPCTSTEPVRLPIGTARARAPRPHHWTETTTPSPARHPNPPIVSIKVHPRPNPSRTDKTPYSLFSPSLLFICPSPHSPLLCKLTRTHPPSPSPCPALASSPENHRSRGGKRGRLPSPATPLASLLPLSGFPDSLRC